MTAQRQIGEQGDWISKEVHANKPDKLMTALPNPMGRFRQMLEDLAKASCNEIDNPRGILSAMVGEKKIVLRPATDHRGRRRFG